MLKGSLLTLLGERSCDNWKALLLEKKAKSMNASHSQKDKKRDKLLFVLLLNLISSSLNHMNKSASLHTEFGLTAFINTNSLLLQYFLTQLNNLPPRVVSSL